MSLSPLRPSVVHPATGCCRGGEQVAIVIEERCERVDRVLFAPPGLDLADLLTYRHSPDIPTRFASMHNGGRLYARTPPHPGCLNQPGCCGTVRVWVLIAGLREPVLAGEFRYEAAPRQQMIVPAGRDRARIANLAAEAVRPPIATSSPADRARILELEAQVARQQSEILRLQARVDELEGARPPQ